MSLLNELGAGGYLHPQYGVVSNVPHVGKRFEETNCACDNYFLFTASAILVCYLRGEREDAKFLASNLSRFLDLCRIESGLYRRFPNIEGSLSWDELFGIALVLPAEATSILMRSLMTDGSFNPQRPKEWTWRTWMLRNVTFTPFMRAAAALPIGYFNQAVWSAAAVVGSFGKREDTSGRQLLWIQTHYMGALPWSSAGAYFLFGRMAKKYPGGPREMLSIYYGDCPIGRMAPMTWQVNPMGPGILKA